MLKSTCVNCHCRYCAIKPEHFALFGHVDILFCIEWHNNNDRNCSFNNATFFVCSFFFCCFNVYPQCVYCRNSARKIMCVKLQNFGCELFFVLFEIRIRDIFIQIGKWTGDTESKRNERARDRWDVFERETAAEKGEKRQVDEQEKPEEESKEKLRRCIFHCYRWPFWLWIPFQIPFICQAIIEFGSDLF